MIFENRLTNTQTSRDGQKLKVQAAGLSPETEQTLHEAVIDLNRKLQYEFLMSFINKYLNIFHHSAHCQGLQARTNPVAVSTCAQTGF